MRVDGLVTKRRSLRIFKPGPSLGAVLSRAVTADRTVVRRPLTNSDMQPPLVPAAFPLGQIHYAMALQRLARGGRLRPEVSS